VLDEADRLLELGFADEVREIVKSCPRGRQTMLYSATLTEEVVDLVNLSLNDPKRVTIDSAMQVVDKLTQVPTLLHHFIPSYVISYGIGLKRSNIFKWLVLIGRNLFEFVIPRMIAIAKQLSYLCANEALLLIPLYSVEPKYVLSSLTSIILSHPIHKVCMYPNIMVWYGMVWYGMALVIKVSAHRLALILGLNQLRAAELHGNLSQQQRLGYSLLLHLLFASHHSPSSLPHLHPHMLTEWPNQHISSEKLHHSSSLIYVMLK
jgi:hypothetical protein